MSADRYKPDRRLRIQRSKLEIRFGFTDENFRNYTGMESTRGYSPVQLRRMSSEMSQHSHPLVRYAAGWATAEAGMHRVQDESVNSLTDRMQSLVDAKKIWEGTIADFKRARKLAVQTDLKADLLGLELRVKQALAYLQSMQIVAALQSGYGMHERDIAKVLEVTKGNVLKFGSENLDLLRQGQGEEFDSIRRGVCNELTGGLFLQEAHSPRHIIIPASVRQDNNAVRGLRSDLVAVSTDPPYGKTLVQIKSHREESDRRQPSDGARFFVYASEDLVLTRRGRARDTLQRLIDRAKGLELPPGVSETIDAKSQSLVNRLVAFVPTY